MITQLPSVPAFSTRSGFHNPDQFPDIHSPRFLSALVSTAPPLKCPGIHNPVQFFPGIHNPQSFLLRFPRHRREYCVASCN